MKVDDWMEIVEIPEKDGIFRVRYHRLSVRAIRSLRTRLADRAWKIRREIAKRHDEIKGLKAELKEKESMLEQLGEDKIQLWLRLEEKRKAEVEKRALQLLKMVIGEKRFNELQEKGSFEFVGYDGKTYRINKDATLQVKEGKYWIKKCVIRPDIPGLPLPDFIASVYVSAKQDPIFVRRSRNLSRREEVTT